jgi:hypothetical protein
MAVREEGGESLGAGLSPMNTALASWTLLGLFRVLLARRRRGVQHALDHLIAAAGCLIVAVAVVKHTLDHEVP